LKNEDKITLKLHIYDSILLNWESLPDNFTLNDLAEVCNLQNRSRFSLQKQLYHLRDLNIIFLGSRKVWHKKHLHLERWFANYLKKLEQEADRQCVLKN